MWRVENHVDNLIKTLWAQVVPISNPEDRLFLLRVIHGK